MESRPLFLNRTSDGARMGQLFATSSTRTVDSSRTNGRRFSIQTIFDELLYHRAQVDNDLAGLDLMNLGARRDEWS